MDVGDQEMYLALPSFVGFKKIHEFNLSMLPRQAWRLISKKESLVFKIFEARYFLNSSFLEAKLGNNPSYVGRNIFATPDIKWMGAQIRIRDGVDRNIWSDLWLLQGVTGRVSTLVHVGLENTNVCRLFRMERKQWDIEVISYIFDSVD
ncbi:uncharacterized mitochondrial protein AtMg00310-like [Mercurialis annua]|uniref:uncharacterized mitochondrial protein AtMg00310-like n=1 Tax=Mercurialis annua TaxID=3986 RepID=UPI00215EA1DD|nr:uncharacterized mitochondrial protein AtMg00310-like [Mercurialis annua]